MLNLTNANGSKTAAGRSIPPEAAVLLYAISGSKAFLSTRKYAVIMAVPVITQEIGYTAISACGLRKCGSSRST